jgi:hypothetical protein
LFRQLTDQRRKCILDPPDRSTSPQRVISLIPNLIQRQTQRHSQLRLGLNRDAKELVEHCAEPSLWIARRISAEEGLPVDFRVRRDQERALIGEVAIRGRP